MMANFWSEHKYLLTKLRPSCRFLKASKWHGKTDVNCSGWSGGNKNPWCKLSTSFQQRNCTQVSYWSTAQYSSCPLCWLQDLIHCLTQTISTEMIGQGGVAFGPRVKPAKHIVKPNGSHAQPMIQFVKPLGFCFCRPWIHWQKSTINRLSLGYPLPFGGISHPFSATSICGWWMPMILVVRCANIVLFGR